MIKMIRHHDGVQESYGFLLGFVYLCELMVCWCPGIYKYRQKPIVCGILKVCFQVLQAFKWWKAQKTEKKEWLPAMKCFIHWKKAWPLHNLKMPQFLSFTDTCSFVPSSHFCSGKQTAPPTTTICQSAPAWHGLAGFHITEEVTWPICFHMEKEKRKSYWSNHLKPFLNVFIEKLLTVIDLSAYQRNQTS